MAYVVRPDPIRKLQICSTMSKTWFDLSRTCYVMLCYIMVFPFYFYFAFISFQSTRKVVCFLRVYCRPLNFIVLQRSTVIQVTLCRTPLENVPHP